MEVHQSAPVQPVGQQGGRGRRQEHQDDQPAEDQPNDDPEGRRRQHAAYGDAGSEPAISVGGLLGAESMTPEARHAFECLAATVEPLRRHLSEAEEELDQMRKNDGRHSFLPVQGRRGFSRELDKLLHRLDKMETRPALILVHLVNGDDIRRGQGRAALDDALSQTVRVLADEQLQVMLMGGLGGNDFAAVVLEDGIAGARQKAEMITTLIGQRMSRGGMPLLARVGVALMDRGQTVDAVIAAADRDFV